MAFKFNPFTGTFDIVGSGSAGLSLSDIVKAFLVEKDEAPLPGTPQITLLFDEDSILFNDDEAL